MRFPRGPRPGVAVARRAVAFACAAAMSGACAAQTWHEDFTTALDPGRWQLTSAGELRAQLVRVVPDVDGPGHRLRLAADTRDTSDHEVKHVGVVSRCALDFRPDARLSFELDWGPPANGSYLSGALVLSPHLTDGDPRSTPDWLSLGYVGVPPGPNARLLVQVSNAGVARTIHDDGWPRPNRLGRKVTRARLELAIRGRSLELRENGRSIPLEGQAPERFDLLHLYLQLSSHSNYAARALHFDSLRITRGADAGEAHALPRAPGCEAHPSRS